jgi:hypothetical protein
MCTFVDKLGDALLEAVGAGQYRLYRTDSRIDDANVDYFEREMRAGRYDGRYFTADPHDAAIYYTIKDGQGHYHGYMLEALIGDGLTTDGHSTDSALTDGAGDEAALARAVSSLRSLGVPLELIARFEVVVRQEDPGMARGDISGTNERVSHYYGSMSVDSLAILVELFRWTGPDHMRRHGQVALLGRRMRGDEFVALHRYTIAGMAIDFGHTSISVKPAYARQFAQ